MQESKWVFTTTTNLLEAKKAMKKEAKRKARIEEEKSEKI